MPSRRRGVLVPPRHTEFINLPTVSVVIPCYNYARYLRQSVLSVIGQKGVETQVIVVDDASTDNSLSTARELEARHEQVTVLSNEANCGPVETFNRGLELANGQYLVRLDADDLLTPGSLRRAVDVCEALPSVGLVYGHPVHFLDEKPPSTRNKVSGWSFWKGMDWVEERCRTGVNVITSPEVLMRMSVVDQVGGQRDLPHGHDMEMWLRIATVSDVAFIRGADQAFHRDHAQSLSARKVDDAVDLNERRKVFATLFDALDGTNPRIARMRRIVDSALAEGGLKSLRVEVQLGLRNPEGFERLLEVVESLPLTEEQHERVFALRREAANTRHSLVSEAKTFFQRLGRRLTRAYRQRHWQSYGVY